MAVNRPLKSQNRFLEMIACRPITATQLTIIVDWEQQQDEVESRDKHLLQQAQYEYQDIPR
jgi:hypothetical protein